jgi:L-alanine-DL-glutamate epimerase-like enolase superfamily enzyme
LTHPKWEKAVSFRIRRVKLGEWSLHFYRLPYLRDIQWVFAKENCGDYALLKLVADNGAAGIAEGVIKPTRSGYSPRSLAVALEDVILPQLRHVDLADARAVAAALEKIPENRLAKALVDNACWTLRAAAAGKPLWELWGGKREVDVCWLVTRQSPGRMAAEAAEACSKHGVRALALKGGQGWEIDMRMLSEVRSAVGTGVELFVDANGSYKREEALEYVHALAHAGVTIAEDPCPLAPDAAYAALQRDCGIPVMVDFACTSAEDARLFVGRGARALALKPARVGFSEARGIDAAAAGGHARVALGMCYESALGTLLSLQLAAALKSPRPLAASQSFYTLLKSQVMRVTPQIRGGRIDLPNDADLEKFVDWKAIQRLQF